MLRASGLISRATRVVIASTFIIGTAKAVLVNQLETFSSGSAGGWHSGENAGTQPSVTTSGGQAGTNDRYLSVFTSANVKSKKDINFSLKKNGEVVQQGNSGLMLNNFDKVVAYISNYFSINIGDLIFTGTPAGVGEVVVGDELEGFLENESMFQLEVK